MAVWYISLHINSHTQALKSYTHEGDKKMTKTQMKVAKQPK